MEIAFLQATYTFCRPALNENLTLNRRFLKVIKLL